jgi:hypothetical protein
VEENIEQPLHLEDWANLGRLLNTILSDISDLDSLSMIVKCDLLMIEGFQ